MSKKLPLSDETKAESWVGVAEVSSLETIKPVQPRKVCTSTTKVEYTLLYCQPAACSLACCRGGIRIFAGSGSSDCGGSTHAVYFANDRPMIATSPSQNSANRCGPSNQELRPQEVESMWRLATAAKTCLQLQNCGCKGASASARAAVQPEGARPI
jgi:hypothetical protein